MLFNTLTLTIRDTEVILSRTETLTNDCLIVQSRFNSYFAYFTLSSPKVDIPTFMYTLGCLLNPQDIEIYHVKELLTNKDITCAIIDIYQGTNKLAIDQTFTVNNTTGRVVESFKPQGHAIHKKDAPTALILSRKHNQSYLAACLESANTNKKEDMFIGTYLTMNSDIFNNILDNAFDKINQEVEPQIIQSLLAQEFIDPILKELKIKYQDTHLDKQKEIKYHLNKIVTLDDILQAREITTLTKHDFLMYIKSSYNLRRELL